MKRLIFADDDPAIQDIVRLIFENIYELTIFSTGEELMNNAFEPPDLFLLDRQISGIDGLNICRFLKSQPDNQKDSADHYFRYS
jgi:CheY-like chemotaxis protein